MLHTRSLASPSQHERALVAGNLVSQFCKAAKQMLDVHSSAVPHVTGACLKAGEVKALADTLVPAWRRWARQV